MTYTGMNAHTGAPLSDLDHIRQSVGDILTTPVGTRVGIRPYGSLLPDLIDQPSTRTTLQRIYGAIALALKAWEQRIRLVRVEVEYSGRQVHLLLNTVLTSGPLAGQPLPIEVTLSRSQIA